MLDTLGNLFTDGIIICGVVALIMLFIPICIYTFGMVCWIGSMYKNTVFYIIEKVSSKCRVKKLTSKLDSNVEDI